MNPHDASGVLMMITPDASDPKKNFNLYRAKKQENAQSQKNVKN